MPSIKPLSVVLANVFARFAFDERACWKRAYLFAGQIDFIAVFGRIPGLGAGPDKDAAVGFGLNFELKFQFKVIKLGGRSQQSFLSVAD